jgi:hypothetical protein
MIEMTTPYMRLISGGTMYEKGNNKKPERPGMLIPQIKKSRNKPRREVNFWFIVSLMQNSQI